MYSGVINVFKERGYTSNDVVQIIKKITRTKVGHTGTLDPSATGVLPICLGRATKIADYIMASDKEYIARVVLGIQTDTGDADGNIMHQMPACATKEDVLAILPQFVGNIVQVPPMYSAIKVGGKKLYEYARSGVEVERKKREIFIKNIEILNFESPTSFVVRVDCSKGTYIRTLCEDIGLALGTVAHMGSLIRTRSGNFVAKESVSLGQLKMHGVERFLIPPDAVLHNYPKISILADGDVLLANGNKIPIEHAPSAVGLAPGQEFLIYSSTGRLAGIFSAEAGLLRPKVML